MTTTKTLFLLASVAALAACAETTEQGEFELGASLGGASTADKDVQTFYCPESPSDCRKMAKEHCGDAGYARVREPGHTGSGMEGAYGGPVTANRSQSDIRRRAGIDSTDSDTLSVRCKKPKEPSE